MTIYWAVASFLSPLGCCGLLSTCLTGLPLHHHVFTPFIGKRKAHVREKLKSGGSKSPSKPFAQAEPDLPVPTFKKPAVADDDLPPGYEEPDLPPPPPGM